MKKKAGVGDIAFWETSYRWLRMLDVDIDKRYCKEEMTVHPDYPALTSLVDFMDMGGMSYQAIKSDETSIHEFNYPALAHIYDGREYMQIIQNENVWNNQKEIKNSWTGIIIYAEKNSQWQNDQNNLYKSNATKRWVFSLAAIIMVLSLFIVASSCLHSLLINVFGLFSLVGLAFGIIALSTEFGFQNEMIKQVCGAISNNGCEGVLKSRYAKGIVGITPADAAIIYFGVQFIMYVFGCIYPYLLQGILLISFTGLIVVVGSIYLQFAKIKEWCAICLGIAAVLVIQSVAAFISPITSAYYPGLIYFLIVFIALTMIYMPVKQLLNTNKINKPKLAELRRWQSDAYLFISQWANEQKIDTKIWPHDLIIGNEAAPLQLIFACNLYCKPCAQVHAKVDDLISKYGDKISVVFRFLTANESKRTIATLSILEAASVFDKNRPIQEILTDWFELSDYEKWGAKWRPQSTNQHSKYDVKERLSQHSNWIKENGIQYTPCFFLNGRKMPSRYSIDNLGMLVPDLAKAMQEYNKYIQ